MSSCVANLPTHLRYVSISSRLHRLLNSLLGSYRPRHLILYGISPGPKELDSDRLQFFMKDYVDDILRLYDEGIIIKTSKYPDGQLRLYLLCCDHLAMCKVCGFGNHSKKEGFCSCCHIPQSELKTEDAMEYDGKSFHARRH
ncbi:hypothetical protein CY34DRAFT_95718 [Suillus luteus UH-Slu-Lm8-n1]|uniref:Uncharacterized protein n=1 Tax=Suillus luteus UH-Slu-Lm8-n1 TaxID=930992 RepID=A0A0D0AUV4_9AGAM|nr:hypothetical protein CY34DRAFT_95718 [Suillus luteus UH-Slu-Lm8-n1]